MPTSWRATGCRRTWLVLPPAYRAEVRRAGAPGAAREGSAALLFGGLKPEVLILSIPGLLIAIVLHEYAHAQVSTWLGDPTPGLHGRLSLNPLAHIDWIGMIMLWVFRFGWARPVQIDPRYYRNPRAGLVAVAVAGPAMNVLVAFVSLLLMYYVPWPSQGTGLFLAEILQLCAIYNAFFAVFNLVPIPPLDGSRILSGLSREGARLMSAIEGFGWILLLILIFTGFFLNLLSAAAYWVLHVLALVAGIRGVF